jgi:threonine/homoserine/homoserine lactone efflux protein
MIPLERLVAFASAALVVVCIPGPDLLLVVMTAATKGRLRGLRVAAGLAAGVLVHTALVAMGVAAAIASVPTLLGAIRLGGVAYLVFLAARSAKDAIWPPAVHPDSAEAPADIGFRGAVIANVTNPKVLIFFVSFLPPFVDPTRAAAPQIFTLGIIFLVLTLLVFGAAAVAASRLVGALGDRMSPRVVGGANAATLAAIAVCLAFLR